MDETNAIDVIDMALAYVDDPRGICPPEPVREAAGVRCADAECEECRACVLHAVERSADELRAELEGLRGRAAPEGLSWPRFEDGEPVMIGDEIYLCGEAREVATVEFSARGAVLSGHGFSLKASDGVRRPAPADTQGRIDADARKPHYAYWGCSGIGCLHCPAKVGGRNPRERYGTDGCADAKTVDLLRRQRELDAKEGSR